MYLVVITVVITLHYISLQVFVTIIAVYDASLWCFRNSQYQTVPTHLVPLTTLQMPPSVAPEPGPSPTLRTCDENVQQNNIQH